MVKAYTSEILSSTYKDDFKDSDNYHRILFNSGRALQARELTQMQTIIQEEIGRVGRHLFKEGAAINPGGVTVNNEYEFIKLDTAVNQLPSNPDDLLGVILTSDQSISFQILQVVPAENADPATLYVRYTNTSAGTPGAEPVRVASSATLTGTKVTVDGNVSYTLSVQSVNTSSNRAVGQGCQVSVHAGDFFTQGHFVFAEQQKKIIAKYTTTPTKSVGFKVLQDIVTVADNTALYDNQGATPNVSSPGADRYRIRLVIATSDEIDSDENYFELAKITRGQISSQVETITSYNEINNVLALRTREESGDYIVKPFELTFDTNDSDNTKLDYIISSGTAYVNGHRAGTKGDSIISVPKPRTTVAINNEVVSASYGNYIVVDGKGGQKGIPNIDTFQEMNLRSAVDHGGSTIGTARVRAVEEEGADFRLYLFKIEMNSGQNFADVKSIGDSATDYWNLVLENTKAVLKDAANNSLLFDLPSNRPQSLSDISLTVQRRFSTQTNVSGSATISLTSSGEVFADTNLWVMGGADSDVDTNATVAGSGTQSATISGAAVSKNPFEVLAYVNKSAGSIRTKTLVETTAALTPDSDGNCTLTHPDIFNFIAIKDTDSDGDDISSVYETDNGQRDAYYDLGKINLRAGNTAPSTVFVRYKHFNHGAGGDFFAVNSYTGQVAYEDIPSFTKADGSKVNLRNVLDFRPVVSSSGDFASGSKINELPRPTDLITFDANYYQGQAAKVSIDTIGQIKVTRGDAAIEPKLPKTPENAIDLFHVIMNPYVVDDNDIQSKQLSYKRFTMADIGKLENRLSRLEETTALSLLELETSQFDVFDSAGLSRNKSGFFVDNFRDQFRADVANFDYRASIDPISNEMRPSFTNRNVGLFYDSDHSENSNVVRRGDNLYLRYDEISYMKNDYVTGTENVNPFAVVTKRGFMELSPSFDEWFETEFTEPIIVDGGFVQGNVNGQIWNDWSFNWSGVESLDVGQQLGDTNIGTQVQRGATFRSGDNNVTPRFRTNESVNVAGVRTVNTFNDEQGVEVSRTFIPFMRTRKIFFRAQGLKPNTRHYPFFANKDVSSWVKQETFQRISTLDSDYSTGYNTLTQHPNTPTASLISDGDGKIEGSFFLPQTNNVKFKSGDRTFNLLDISSNNEEYCTSIAAEKYYSQGITIHRQQTVLSTRVVDLDVTQTTVPLAPTVEARRRGKDPLAQTFLIEDLEGVFITSIKVRFKTKPTSGAAPVVAQLRPVVNGIPSADTFVPGSTVFKAPSAITTSDDGTSLTTFKFDEPVYLTGNEEYAIVLLSDSNDYEVYVAEAGAFLLGSTERKLQSQATLGSLFKSQNGRTWEPDQTKDLTFELTRAQFDSTGTMILENKSPNAVNVTNAITTTDTSATIRIALKDHGFVVGDSVTIKDAAAVGGIAANNINGVQTVTAIDGDNFELVAGGTATATTTGGGSFTIQRQNMFETMMIKADNILPPTTTIDVSGKLTSGKSLAGAETAYQKDTSYTAFPINRNIYFSVPKLLATEKNANDNIGAGSKSTTFKFAMASVSDKVSPVIDLQKVSVATIHNRIDQQVASGSGGNIPLTYAAETNARGGTSLGKHLTFPVTLDSKAKGLKIMLSANKPSVCSFDVYYRTNSATQLRDTAWTLIAPELAMPSDDNPVVFRDYRFLPGGIGGSLDDFDQFQVKIVMKSTNSAKVPRFGDLRIIALSV